MENESNSINNIPENKIPETSPELSPTPEISEPAPTINEIITPDMVSIQNPPTENAEIITIDKPTFLRKKFVIPGMVALFLIIAGIVLINILNSPADKKESFSGKNPVTNTTSFQTDISNSSENSGTTEKSTTSTTSVTTESQKTPSFVSLSGLDIFTENVLEKINNATANIELSLSAYDEYMTTFQCEISKKDDVFVAYQEAVKSEYLDYPEQYTIISDAETVLMFPEYSDKGVIPYEYYNENDIWNMLYNGAFIDELAQSILKEDIEIEDTVKVTDGFVTGEVSISLDYDEDYGQLKLIFKFFKDGDKQIMQMIESTVSPDSEDAENLTGVEVAITYGEFNSERFPNPEIVPQTTKDKIAWFREIDEKYAPQDEERYTILNAVFGSKYYYDAALDEQLEEELKDVYSNQVIEETITESQTKSVRFELNANKILEKKTSLRDVMEINYFVNGTGGMVGHPFEFETECDVKSGNVIFTVDLNRLGTSNFSQLAIYYYPIDVDTNQIPAAELPTTGKAGAKNEGILTCEFNGNGFYLVMDTAEWYGGWGVEYSFDNGCENIVGDSPVSPIEYLDFRPVLNISLLPTFSIEGEELEDFYPYPEILQQFADSGKGTFAKTGELYRYNYKNTSIEINTGNRNHVSIDCSGGKTTLCGISVGSSYLDVQKLVPAGEKDKLFAEVKDVQINCGVFSLHFYFSNGIVTKMRCGTYLPETTS